MRAGAQQIKSGNSSDFDAKSGWKTELDPGRKNVFLQLKFLTGNFHLDLLRVTIKSNHHWNFYLFRSSQQGIFRAGNKGLNQITLAFDQQAFSTFLFFNSFWIGGIKEKSSLRAFQVRQAHA